VPAFTGPARTEPFGRSSESRTPQHEELPTVTSSTTALTRRPDVPAKVKTAFWPGTVVERLAGAPPGTSDPATSSGTS
jgi:hypothetical protein